MKIQAPIEVEIKYGARFHEVLNALDLTPNAKVSGAGMASAGLPGCASNGKYNERTEK
jgi:hypothetical protein